ncbi:MAG TPA: RecQ family zinc-binding domain-containing protein, partial [Conexibacter sp.]|nr:RecQ family zinc-binding domain-containing protein [Conexibacter sp.]
ADVAGMDRDGARAIVGHLARAGVVQPAPSPPDRAIGRLLGEWERGALRACKASAGEAQRVRWRQYRAIWGFVEQRRCRRAALLRHFGDRAAPETDPGVICCDVCDPAIAPPGPAVAARRREADLDEAILAVIAAAAPAVTRTQIAEILRGSRSRAIAQHAWDGLPQYGAFPQLRGDQVTQRVDMLLARGALRTKQGTVAAKDSPSGTPSVRKLAQGLACAAEETSQRND